MSGLSESAEPRSPEPTRETKYKMTAYFLVGAPDKAKD